MAVTIGVPTHSPQGTRKTWSDFAVPVEERARFFFDRRLGPSGTPRVWSGPTPLAGMRP
ncbi:hypothetical protein LFX25_15445 [Leptospira sp. FAT2]|uniref:hypothetical protein n=1 Tax=Leptospira sanjuanensis TaxID=2879643 RepID=UPI001EE7E520|nr:hypothetical protein [Leptospira sanjuanensis]MCG6194638.1 hypothetical protein [Leptospira sanjuanensis]